MTIRTNLRSVSAAAMLGVAALTATAAPMVLAPAAVAQGPEAVNPANIDTNRSGSITIHKHSGTPSDINATGEEMDASSFGPTLKGAQFKATQLEADLGSIDSFNAAVNKYKNAADVTPADFKQDGYTGTETTDKYGLATFSEIPVGVYYVEETVAPNGHDPIEPFIVFVPMTTGANDAATSEANAWNYDVQVYPKDKPNQGQVLKNITDGTVDGKDYKNSGEEISFDIFSKVPKLSDTLNLKSFVMYDDLQENMIQVDPSKVQVNIVSANIPENELASGAEAVDPNFSSPLAKPTTVLKLGAGDFGVNLTPAQEGDHEGNGSGYVLSVWLTKSGLDKVNERKSTADLGIQVTIPATVKETDQFNKGVLKNRARVLTNTGFGEPTDETPGETPPGDTPPGETPPGTTNEVEARWGRLVINKFQDKATPVQATFDLYRCENADNLLGGAIRTGIQTGPDGIVNVDGLHTTDLVQDQHSTDGAYKYCLVETKTENGLQLLPKPKELDFRGTDLDATGQGLKPELDTDWSLVADVQNQNIPKLPLTGGKGIALIVAIGVALVGGGVAYARRASKKA